MNDLAQFALVTTTSVLFIVDPVAVIPTYLIITQRGESLVQRAPGGDGRPNGPVRSRLLEHLIVVFGGGDVALEQDVGVGVDQPGQHRQAGQVDRLGPGGTGRDLCPGAHGGDAPVLDQDALVPPRCVGQAIDEPARPDHGARRDGRLGGEGRGKRRGRPEGQQRARKQEWTHAIL